MKQENEKNHFDNIENENIEPTNYKQWAEFFINPKIGKSVQIKNVVLPWGKFYRPGDKNIEINKSNIEDLIIPISPTYSNGYIATCGRSNSPSGTEGSFDIYLTETNEKLFSLYWDCPFSGSNKLTITKHQSKYSISSPNVSKSGPIGSHTLDIYTR